MSLAQATTLSPCALSERRTAACMIGVSMLLWTLIEAMGHHYTRAISAPQVVWTRYGTHLLFMAAVRFPRKGLSIVKTRQLGMQIGRGLLMLLMPVAYILAWLEFDQNTNDVWAAYWVEPLMILACGYVLLRERVSLGLVVLCLIGYAGVMMIMQPSQGLLSPKLIYPLLMAAFYTIYVIMTRRMIDEPIDTKLFYTAASVFVPITLLMPFVWVTPTLSDWMRMAFIGIAGYFLLLCLELAIDRAPVSYLAPFVFVRVIWGVMADYIFDGKAPDAWGIAGTLLIIAVMTLHYAWTSRDLNEQGEARA